MTILSPYDGAGVAGSPAEGKRVAQRDGGTSTRHSQIWDHGVPRPRIQQWILEHMSFSSNGWVAGSSGAGSGVTALGDATHPGYLVYTTGTATTGRFARTWGASTSPLKLDSASGVTIYETKFRIPTLSDVTDTFSVRAGFLDLLTGAPVDGVYFELESNADAQLQCVTANNSTRTTTDSGLTISAATWYRARIEITDNTSAAFFCAAEGSPLGAALVTTATNLPANTRTYYAAANVLKSAGTNARTLEVAYQLFGSDRYA